MPEACESNSAEAVRISQAATRVQQMLMDRRNPSGWWTGQLSTSALSTATATLALHLALQKQHGETDGLRFRKLVAGGLQWLIDHQNADGGWGDTVLSISNISTSMLAHAVLVAAGSSREDEFGHSLSEAVSRSQEYISQAGGVDAVLNRYGNDRTFSVPILTHCALAGLVDWKRVIPLPFELSCIPARFYAAVRMPVVSYALPALIAIGQVIFRHQGHWNPLVRWIRRAAIQPSLRVLESIQPPNGGFLEATPLTSFVCMSLLGCGLDDHIVTRRCLQFITDSVRDDGSWPIDTNLTTWVTTLSVNGLTGDAGRRGMHHEQASGEQASGEQASGEQAEDGRFAWPLQAEVDRQPVRDWLLGQQYRTVHPYTNAAPGGWAWTDLPGGVPDADDTPGAILAILNLRPANEAPTQNELDAVRKGIVWLLDLQNSDGGWPTFCRGWGTLPFDRSSNDLTAHTIRAIRAWMTHCQSHQPGSHDSPPYGSQSGDTLLLRRATTAVERGLMFLKKKQRPDGSWLPLWFGHQFNIDDQNPLYGTAKVLMALDQNLNTRTDHVFVSKAIRWMLDQQNEDGGWSAAKGLESSVEETGLAVEALSAKEFLSIEGVAQAARRGALWLTNRVNEGTVVQTSPIGFYFAKLWYFEELYPIIFAAAGLSRWQQTNCNDVSVGRQ